ncbi:DUF917 domain-containing protein [Wolbachia endosymbiont (group A) of Sphecodes ephippius]|uniref:DUF917 domain-containing protein n=1 Tax=Wolbachia endosymbiont (group A) of Sphecodes ephippius TaxID=2954059 RepID=UPI00221F3B37|nr:DUF917 domain-containing protein [Wolbachia endosymbiont (group A) of Sphecodes ephippius]
MKKINQLTLNNIEALSLGAGLLGSGGGGNTYYNKLSTQYKIELHGEVAITDIDELEDDALIMPIGFMGAPLVAAEKLPSKECHSLIDVFTLYYKKEPTALIPAEIGGSNAFTPFLAAGKVGIPVIDGDLMGRAFPSLNMVSPNLYGISCCPAFFADSLGNTIIMHIESSDHLERVARAVIVACGSSIGVSCYPITGQQAKQVICRNSISYACFLGNIILEARERKICPIKALCDKHALLLGEGIIRDIDQSIKGGFLSGNVSIEGCNNMLTIIYQNEYLAVYDGSDCVAATPDIIAVLDKDTGYPIASEALTYGIRVSVLKFPSLTLWTTPEGLAIVGPEVFGLSEKRR